MGTFATRIKLLPNGHYLVTLLSGRVEKIDECGQSVWRLKLKMFARASAPAMATSWHLAEAYRLFGFCEITAKGRVVWETFAEHASPDALGRISFGVLGLGFTVPGLPTSMSLRCLFE